MSKSNSLENSILDHILGGPDYTRVATVYVALYTSAPTDAGGGTQVTGSGYARVSLTNNTTNFPNASSGQKTNGTLISFPQATGDWSAGADITHFAIHSHVSNDAIMYWGSLTTPKKVFNGDTIRIPIGSLVITED